MFDVDYVDDYKNRFFQKTNSRLELASKIMAFINTYGPLYDRFYFALILNLNNIIEHYLVTGNDKIILSLYSVYSNDKAENKSEKEIFIDLRNVFYQLPVYTINEVEQRRLRK